MAERFPIEHKGVLFQWRMEVYGGQPLPPRVVVTQELNTILVWDESLSHLRKGMVAVFWAHERDEAIAFAYDYATTRRDALRNEYIAAARDYGTDPGHEVQ